MDNSQSSDSFHSCDSTNSSPESLHFNFGDKLDNVFAKFPRNLNVCHIKAQSVPAHHSEFLNTFRGGWIHACLISETFLKPALPSRFFSLPVYVLIRNDRTGKGVVGVAIYLWSDITFQIISKSASSYCKSMEYIFLEIIVGTIQFLLGVVSMHFQQFIIFVNVQQQRYSNPWTW